MAVKVKNTTTYTKVMNKKQAYKEEREIYIAQRLAANAKFCMKEPVMFWSKVVCFIELVVLQPWLYATNTDYVDICITHAIGILSLAVVLARGRALVNFGLVDELPYMKKKNNNKKPATK